MKKSILIAGTMLVFGASAASAAGINLSWNDCGEFGVANVSFACNSNAGAGFTAIASFIAPGTLPEYLGLSSQVDLTSQSPNPLPEWWKHGTGTCRGATGLSISFDFTAGPFSCLDFFAGQAAGGFVYEFPNSPSAGNRGRIRVTCAVPFDNRGPISEADGEYYAYKVNLLRAKTTGTGSCPGCNVPVCMVLDNIQLFQPPEQANDPVLSNPINREWVTWQAADPTCPASTPAANKTWGQVKSLYR